MVESEWDDRGRRCGMDKYRDFQDGWEDMHGTVTELKAGTCLWGRSS